MARKKNLERAVVLGLLLSTSVYSSAWADFGESLYVENILDANGNPTAGNPLYGIWGWKSHHGSGGIADYREYDREYDNITVTVRNNYYLIGETSGDQAIGIGDAGDAGVILVSGNGITVNVETRNAQNGYGLNAVNPEKGIDLTANTGDITVDVSKTKGLANGSLVDPAYENSIVHGINVENSSVNLNAAKGNISITAYYNTEAAQENSKLLEGNIYAIGNSNGTVNLNAGKAITLSATAHNGDAYGFDSYEGTSNVTAGSSITIDAESVNGKAYALKFLKEENSAAEENRFESNYNHFIANSTNGEAYALLAEKGTKVDIIGRNGNVFESNKTGVKLIEGSVLNATGNTIIKGTENGLIISGNGTSTTADGDETYQVVVDGDLYSLSGKGISSHLQNGASLHVTGDHYFDNDKIIEGGSTEKVDGSLVGFKDVGSGQPFDEAIEGTGLTVKENSTLTVGGNIILSATETALDVNRSSVTASGADGSNYIKGGTNGIRAVGSDINLNGVTYIEGTKGIGVSADVNSVFNVTGHVTVVGDTNGIVLTGKSSATEQSKITGNLLAAAENGTAITLTDTKLTVNGDEIIYGENGLVITDSVNSIDGSLSGIANDTAVKITDTDASANTNLTIGGNIGVEGGKYGVVAENATVTVKNENGYGVNYIAGGEKAVSATDSTISLDAGSDGRNILISTDSNALYAVDSTVTVSGGRNTIITGEKGSGANAIYTGTAINATNDSNTAGTNGSTVNILGNENFIGGTVRANGEDTVVNIGGSLANGNLTSAGSNYITSAAHGVGTGSNASVVATVFAQNDANVNIKGERNYIIAKAESIDSGNKYDERAVWAQGGSQVNIEGETIISASKAEVVFDENGIPENITLDDLKNNNLGIAIAAGTGEITGITDPGDLVENIPEGVGKSTINLNYKGSSVILGDIVSGWNGLVNIGDGVETSSNGNKLNFYGSAMAANGGQINLDLGGGGVWYGRADDYQDAGGDSHNSYFNPAFSNKIIDNGTVNLKMGTGSKWFVQGQSWISNITIDENAENTLIDLVSANTDHNSTAHALTIGELNGDTTFHMSLDGDRTTSDMLYIKEANGDYIVTLEEAVQTADMYTDGANRFNGLRFATIGAGSNADFRVFSSDTGFYDVEYQVEREEYDVNSDENNHYNSSNGNGNGDMEKPGDDSLGDFFGDSSSGSETQNAKIALLDEVAANDEKNQSNISADNIKITGRIGEQMSDAAQTMLNMSRANYSNAIYMDRLNKRMGEARYLNDEENEGMWVRLRHDRIGKEDAYRSQNTMYEIGYDVKQECDNGERRIGMAIDYMHGDTGYSDISGRGEIDRYGLWMYDTWMGDKGHYADYVAKWGHLSNDFEIYNSREKVTGDYSNNVFSISAEYGKKNDMGNDWYFEPQVQAQLARVTGADYTTSQGTKVSVDGINSLIGRAGFRIGKDFGAEKQSTVYLKADVLHEFLGDQTIRALDDSTDGRWADVSYENEGTWYDVGFGFATQISKASYAFMDFEKSFGNDNDETYQINVGMQWSF